MKESRLMPELTFFSVSILWRALHLGGLSLGHMAQRSSKALLGGRCHCDTATTHITTAFCKTPFGKPQSCISFQHVVLTG